MAVMVTINFKLSRILSPPLTPHTPPPHPHTPSHITPSQAWSWCHGPSAPSHHTHPHTPPPHPHTPPPHLTHPHPHSHTTHPHTPSQAWSWCHGRLVPSDATVVTTSPSPSSLAGEQVIHALYIIIENQFPHLRTSQDLSS